MTNNSGNSPRRDSMDGRNANAVGLGGVGFPNMINESNINAFSRHMAANNMNNAVSGKAGINNNLANAQFYGMGINSPGPMGMGMTAQSMTPPPMNSMDASMNGFPNALTGPNNSLYMNGMRLMNPASEGKYMTRNGIINQNAAFAAAGMGNFGTASSQVMNNQAGMHFNHQNGMQQVNNQTSNNYSSNNSNNRSSTQRT